MKPFFYIWIFLLPATTISAQQTYVDTLKTLYQQGLYDQCGSYSLSKWNELMDVGDADSMTVYEMAYHLMPYLFHTKDYAMIRRINTMGISYFIYQVNNDVIHREQMLREWILYMGMYDNLFKSMDKDYTDEMKYAIGWPFCIMLKLFMELNGLVSDTEDLLKLFVRGGLEICYDPVQVEELLDYLSKFDQTDKKRNRLIQEMRDSVKIFRNRNINVDNLYSTVDFSALSKQEGKLAMDKTLPEKVRWHHALRDVAYYYMFATTYFHSVPLLGGGCTNCADKYYEMDMTKEYRDSLADVAYNCILHGKAAGLYSNASFKQFVQDCGNRTLAKEAVWRPYDSGLYSEKEYSTIETIQKITGNQGLMPCYWYQIRDKLKPHDIAVEFEQNGNYLYALVVTHDSQHPSILQLCTQYGVRLGDKSIYYSTNAYEDVWSKIIAFKPDVHTIYFSPCTLVDGCGIEYALTPDGQFICDKYNMYRVSNTREIADFRIHRNTLAKTVAFGGMKYNLDDNEWILITTSNHIDTIPALRDVPSLQRGAMDGIPELPGSREEVMSIYACLQKEGHEAECNTDLDATEDSFKSLTGKDISCIVISTHSVAEQKRSILSFNPKELSSSALLFTGAVNGLDMYSDNKQLSINDGILTAKEISEMDLRHVDLAVLSACETGVGTLMHGFKMAGVRSIVMSLWKVDDNATQLLMKEFFRNLIEGKSKRESFVLAQIYLRNYNNHQYEDPKYWAAFILLDGLD